ncbi:MAG: hypothetical protein M3N39_13990 [Pseudomonadota bacterium]|nr:hypothetical protein [Pseudomonadota bacterium]
MFNNDLSRTALSALGALLLTATLVGAAVGPAHMVETVAVVYAGAAPQVGGGIDA